MKDQFSDELISAYLDGELTADQQAQVEQVLMDSVEHRRMFEELRTLRGTLQSLPSHQLDNDFCKRVLRRAERAMLAPTTEELSTGDSPTDEKADAPFDEMVPSNDPPIEKVQPAAPPARRWFGVAVAVSTVAAASLLLALFAFSDVWNDKDPVVKRPDSPVVESKRDGWNENHEARKDITDNNKAENQNGNNARASQAKKLQAKGDPQKAADFKAGDNRVAGGRGGVENSGNTNDNQDIVRPNDSPQVSLAVDRAAINKAVDENLKNLAAYQSILVVVVEMAPNERSPVLLYETLQKNQILPEPSLQEAVGKFAPLKDADVARADALQKRKAYTDDRAGDMEMVFVVASLDQVQETLDELKEKQNRVRNVRTEWLVENKEGALPHLFSSVAQSGSLTAARGKSSGRGAPRRENDKRPAATRRALSAPGVAASGAAAPKAPPPSAPAFEAAKQEALGGSKPAEKKDAVEKSAKSKNNDAKKKSLAFDKNRQRKPGQPQIDATAYPPSYYRLVQPRSFQRFKQQIKYQRSRNFAPAEAKLPTKGKRDANQDGAANAITADNIAAEKDSKADFGAAYALKQADPNRKVRVLFVIQIVDKPKAAADADKTPQPAKQK